MIFVKVKQRFYQDSLKLMGVSGEISALAGVIQAFAFMGTEINKATRIPKEVLTEEAKLAGPDDLILMVECESEAIAKKALLAFDEKITKTSMAATEGSREIPITTLDCAVEQNPDTNLAIISVPGEYAAAQAMRALQLGLHVHLFSDNVSIEDEVRLKKFAVSNKRLLMGPDCGTAIIQGQPLCFANAVGKGGIGMIAASGTGAQEVSCIIDSLGEGVSHIIGVGGRDLSEEVGGLMTLYAIELLAKDPDTKVMAIVSKPPAPSVSAKILEAVKAANKPAIFIFMGHKSDNPLYAQTLEEGAAKAVALLRGENPESAKTAFRREPVGAISFLPGQKQIRGLYTGGTLASEAKYMLEESGIESFEILDLGDDEYTRGALHPMIDPARRSRMVQAAVKDPCVAIVLCDVVIGFGSHPNPAGELAKALRGVKACVLASVTGTDADLQNKAIQEGILKDAGILVFPSNQSAVEAAIAMKKEENR